MAPAPISIFIPPRAPDAQATPSARISCPDDLVPGVEQALAAAFRQLSPGGDYGPWPVLLAPAAAQAAFAAFAAGVTPPDPAPSGGPESQGVGPARPSPEPATTASPTRQQQQQPSGPASAPAAKLKRRKRSKRGGVQARARRARQQQQRAHGAPSQAAPAAQPSQPSSSALNNNPSPPPATQPPRQPASAAVALVCASVERVARDAFRTLERLSPGSRVGATLPAQQAQPSQAATAQPSASRRGQRRARSRQLRRSIDALSISSASSTPPELQVSPGTRAPAVTPPSVFVTAG